MARLHLLCLTILVTFTPFSRAQQSEPGNPPSNLPSPSGPGSGSQGSGAGDGTGTANTPGNAETSPSAISSNPGAVNLMTGTGALGRFLGFDKESGVYIGGAWLGDANWLMSGGVRPGEWSLNSLAQLSVGLDSEKLIGWKGGLFGVELLQFNGSPTNDEAGAVQGYNSLVAAPPLDRTELYELWWRQEFFDKKLVVRIGKSVPTYDFNNVSRPVPSTDPSANIPSVSGLAYTPVFVNSTLLGVIPGYYNSATGITATWAPSSNFYFSYGVYDGNRATGDQIGLRGPQFNGHYFNIWEAGVTWKVGIEDKPGSFGIGLWDQTGKLTAASGLPVEGAQGFYFFGAQRLWFQHPGLDNSGISGFWQYGANNSDALLAHQYFGLGLTGFGLVPSRPKDSMGCGMAWAWLNEDPNAGAFFFPGVPSNSTSLRNNELMFQSYYQMQVFDGAYLQPTLSYIPNPGERPDLKDAWAATIRLTLLF